MHRLVKRGRGDRSFPKDTQNWVSWLTLDTLREVGVSQHSAETQPLGCKLTSYSFGMFQHFSFWKLPGRWGGEGRGSHTTQTYLKQPISRFRGWCLGLVLWLCGVYLVWPDSSVLVNALSPELDLLRPGTQHRLARHYEKQEMSWSL